MSRAEPRAGAARACLLALAAATLLGGCFKGADGNPGTALSSSANVAVTPPPNTATPPIVTAPGPVPPTVAIAGRVTWERVPQGTSGLDYAGTVAVAARGVPVEAISIDGYSVVAATVTDENGNYSMVVPSLTPMFVRAHADVTPASLGGLRIRALDLGGMVHYADGPFFDSGRANSTRNVVARSGWDGVAYAQKRAAAPFALLETVRQVAGFLRAADPTLALPDFDVHWAPENRPLLAGESVDYATGLVGATHVVAGLPARLYVLGAADVDTDEYDPHVIAAAFGRWLHRDLARDDAPAGAFVAGQPLDPRLAFSLAWPRAFAGMATGVARFHDTHGPAQGSGRIVNLESNPATGRGWYSPASLQSLLYDLHDGANDGADLVQLGFAPLHAALRAIAAGDAFVTIHSFAAELLRANPAQAVAIEQLFAGQQVAVAADDAFGTVETNDGGDPANLPIYVELQPFDTVEVCVAGGATPSATRLGHRRFVHLSIAAAATLRVRATGPDDADPELVLVRRGVELARAEATGPEDSLVADFAPGSYVLELYERSHVEGGTPRGPTCFDVAVEMP